MNSNKEREWCITLLGAGTGTMTSLTETNLHHDEYEFDCLNPEPERPGFESFVPA